MNWPTRSGQVGLLQPVVVRAVRPGQYELIMGERRWRAASAPGLTEIPAIVKQTQTTTCSATH